MRSAESNVGVPPRTVDTPRARTRAVQIWAFFGGALLLLQLYVWFQWVTGPYFVPVPTGVSDPPMYMKVFLSLNAGVLALGFPFAIWHFWVKPWRRERTITLDGMLMLALGLMVFQDPLLNYFNTWCTYNTWLWNMGAWTSHVPGWSTPEEPGRMVSEPLINNFIGYGYGVLMTIMLGCWVMKKAKQRWPGISNLRLIGVAFLWSYTFDFVMEGMLLLPFGFYAYPGAIRAWSLNAGTYYQYPLYEGLMWGSVETAICCLRFFTDSQGRTIVERGLGEIGGGFVKQQLTRFLAIFAAVSASFFFFYMAPAQWFSMHSDPWPEDVQKRSYFVGGICGESTGKVCPNPLLPIPTKRSGHINADGQFVLPEGAEMPKIVPFERGGN